MFRFALKETDKIQLNSHLVVLSIFSQNIIETTVEHKNRFLNFKQNHAMTIILLIPKYGNMDTKCYVNLNINFHLELCKTEHLSKLTKHIKLSRPTTSK